MENSVPYSDTQGSKAKGSVSSPLSQADTTGEQATSWPPHLEGAVPGLKLCCHPLKVLNVLNKGLCVLVLH